MKKLTKLSKAITFFTSAHRGQYQKINGLPLASHLTEVMLSCQFMGMNEDCLIAAMGHHYFTDFNSEELLKIRNKFGTNVVTIMMGITRHKAFSGSTESKINWLNNQVAKNTLEVRLIKLAERITTLGDLKQSSSVSKEDIEGYALQFAHVITSIVETLDLGKVFPKGLKIDNVMHIVNLIINNYPNSNHVRNQYSQVLHNAYFNRNETKNEKN